MLSPMLLMGSECELLNIKPILGPWPFPASCLLSLWINELQSPRSCYQVISKPLCSFSCTQQGNMAVTVTYGGDPVPKSPFVVNVAPPLDLSKVKVQGLNSSK